MHLRLQFKLRSLLLTVTCCAIVVGGYAQRYHKSRAPRPAPIIYRDRIDEKQLISGSEGGRDAVTLDDVEAKTIVGKWAAVVPSAAIGGRTRLLLNVGPPDSISRVSTSVSLNGQGFVQSVFGAATDRSRESICFVERDGFKEQFGFAAEGVGRLVAPDRLEFHGRFVLYDHLIVVDAELKRVSRDWTVLQP